MIYIDRCWLTLVQPLNARPAHRSPLRHVLRTAGIHQGKLAAAVAGPVGDKKRFKMLPANLALPKQNLNETMNCSVDQRKCIRDELTCARRGCLYHGTDFDEHWAMAPDNKQCRMLKRQEKMAVQSLKGPWVAPRPDRRHTSNRDIAIGKSPDIDCWSFAMDQNQANQ